MASKFQGTGTTTIQLSDGDWIEIKTDLNNGDQKLLEAAGQKAPISLNGKIVVGIDWAVYEIERAAIYLVAWSLKDLDGKPTKPSIQAMQALTPEGFEEIQNAIYKHIEGRLALKKAARETQTTATLPQFSTSEAVAAPTST